MLLGRYGYTRIVFYTRFYGIQNLNCGAYGRRSLDVRFCTRNRFEAEIKCHLNHRGFDACVVFPDATWGAKLEL